MKDAVEKAFSEFKFKINLTSSKFFILHASGINWLHQSKFMKIAGNAVLKWLIKYLNVSFLFCWMQWENDENAILFAFEISFFNNCSKHTSNNLWLSLLIELMKHFSYSFGSKKTETSLKIDKFPK